MKKFAVIAFGMFLFALPTKAQTLESQYGLDSAQTILNASLYTEYWKQKNFEEALPTWRYVFLNAPAFQLNTYKIVSFNPSNIIGSKTFKKVISIYYLILSSF